MNQDDQSIEDIFDREEAKEAERWLRQREFTAVRTLSNAVARIITKSFGWLTPNLVTLFGAILCCPAIWFMIHGFKIISIVLLALSFLTDFLDGAMARYQMRRYHMPELPPGLDQTWSLQRRLFARGKTSFGAVLDPFIDKVRYFMVLFTLGYGFVSSFLIWGSLAIAIALTAIRPFMRNMNLGSGASNRLGKYKVFIEVFALLNILVFTSFYPENQASVTISNLLVGSAMIAGLGSFSGHLFLVVRKHRHLRLHRKKQ